MKQIICHLFAAKARARSTSVKTSWVLKIVSVEYKPPG